MFRNYLKLVLRKFRKDKLYSIVNISGITIGLTAFLLIALFVRDELSYDRFHKDEDQLFRLINENKQNGFRSGYIPPDFAEYILEDVPGIESFTRITQDRSKSLLQYQDKVIYSGGVFITDSNFFETFNFKLINGHESNVLSKGYNAVLSVDFARKLFGEIDPIGKEIELDKKETIIVTGLSEVPRSNSSIKFDIIIKAGPTHMINTFDQGRLTNVITYLRTTEKADLEQLEQSINEVKSKPNYAEILENTDFQLQSIKDQYLKGGLEYDKFEIGDIRFVYLFSGIGLVILILAIINYVNLVTAQSIKRSKEIGLRKVVGASKIQLVYYQFFESVVITTFSLMLAFAITERLIPIFNDKLDKAVSLNYLSLEFLVIVPLLGVLLGVISGAYPAFCIGRYKAITMLRNDLNTGVKKSGVRKVLVLFQFASAGILILVTVIMHSQMSYLAKRKMGFDQELLVYVSLFSDLKGRSKVFKNEVLKMPGVASATVTDWIVGDPVSTSRYADRVDRESRERPPYVNITSISADEDIIKTLRLEVLQKEAGFEFDQLDSTNTVISQSVADGLGWSDNPLGKFVYSYGGQRRRVVAVVEDFHSASLKEEIKPTIIEVNKIWGEEKLLIRFNASDHQQALLMLGERYETLLNRPFEFEYIDQEIERFYSKEVKQVKLFNLFSSLAIIISLLGLLAMTAYLLEQKRKEVSIRKVLGASIKQLILMLNKEYIGLIFIAFLIASPIAYYAIQNWLSEFKYRIVVSPFLFIGVFAAFLALSWLVTIFQSLKVTVQNPADVLREE